MLNILVYLKLFYLKLRGVSRFFITDDGLGDSVMGTVVARNYFQRTGKKCSIIHSYQDVFKNNPYIFPIKGISPYFFSQKRRHFLEHWGIFITLLSTAHIKRTVKGEPYPYFSRENFLRRLCIQAGFTEKVILEPEIYLTPKEKSFGAFYKRQIVITMGSGLYKQLEKQKIQRLINLLKTEYHFIQIGSVADFPLKGVLDLRGKLSIRSTAAILFHSRLFIGPIGGIMHVARAVKCPGVIIHASAEYFDSYYPEFRRVYNQHSCSKCIDDECYAVGCNLDFSCANDIPFEDILAAVRTELAEPKREPAANVITLPERKYDSIRSKEAYSSIRNVKLSYRSLQTGNKWATLVRPILMDNRFYEMNFWIPENTQVSSLYLELESSDFIYQFFEISIYDYNHKCIWKSLGDAKDFLKIDSAIYFCLDSGYCFLPFGSRMKLYFPDTLKNKKIQKVFLRFSLKAAYYFNKNSGRQGSFSDFNFFSYTLGCFITYLPRRIYSFFSGMHSWMNEKKQKIKFAISKKKNNAIAEAQKMMFSIITVCKNSEKTIRRTFDAMLNQSCKDYEYIVIDGVSTDSTVAIIREYEPRFEGRMRWISEPDHGLYDAMNKGIRMANGEIIGICNSDDFYEPDALLQVKNVADKEKEKDLYYGIVRYLDQLYQEKELLRVSADRLKTTCMIHPGCFVRRNVYEKYGFFSLKYPIAADYDFMLRLYLHGGRFQPVDFILTNFFEWDGVSSRDWRKGLMDGRRVKYAHGLLSLPEYILLWMRYGIGRILKILHLI